MAQGALENFPPPSQAGCASNGPRFVRAACVSGQKVIMGGLGACTPLEGIEVGRVVALLLT
eukprot:6465258-Amphidinium_carterae.2